jgi:KDO2-lipid IV(A) lauroyltransferase
MERPPSLYSLRAFQIGLWLARVLPRPIAQWLGPHIGRAVMARRPAAREALRDNLRLVTGDDDERLDPLCAANVANFSRMLADYFLCAGTAGDCAGRLLERWSGIEHIEAARALGKGVILVTAHLGNWELGGILLAQHGLPLTVVTLEEPSSELTRWRDACRQRLGIKTITVGPGHDFTFIEMIQALRRNEIVAMLVDRPYAGSGTAVTFFGQLTKFSTAPALLWQHTNAAVVPAFVLQSADGRYVSCADPMLAFAPHADSRAGIASNTQQLATHFETIIRQHPEQWFNYVPIWNPSSSPSASS